VGSIPTLPTIKIIMKNICVFGDSTAWGAWDEEKGGWVNRLWLYLSQNNHDKTVYNLSISGGTSETILARFEAEANIRHADFLIFQSGGNDAAYIDEPGNHQVQPDKFKSNLELIIAKASKITENILFVSFKNCDEAKTTPVSWRNIFYTNKDIEKYNRIMQKACDEKEVMFLDIFGLLDSADFSDGLHPNAQGHEKIFQKVKNFLEEHDNK
jgi:lysophospholipase L1-like esterase